MVVLRASAVALFTRQVTQGEGGDSTDDTVQLSLLKMESLVDNAVVGGVDGTSGDGRRISQVSSTAKSVLWGGVGQGLSRFVLGCCSVVWSCVGVMWWVVQWVR